MMAFYVMQIQDRFWFVDPLEPEPQAEKDGWK